MDQGLYKQGVAAFNAKDYRKAISMFRNLPACTVVLYNIGSCHKELHEFHEGAAIFERLIAGRIKNPELRENTKNNYISCVTCAVKEYADRCMFKEALELNLHALDVLQNQPMLLYNMGHLLKCTGDHERALEYLDRSLDANPFYFDGYIEQINIHNDAGRYEKAIDVMYRGLKMLPDDARFYNEAGVALCRLGRIKDGFEAYEKGLACKSCTPVIAGKIHTNVGNAFSHIGDIPKSLEHSKKAYELDDKNNTAMQNYLMNMLYVPDLHFNHTLREHFEVGGKLAKIFRIDTYRPYEGPKNKKIRVGYVSGDFFGEHPMTYFLRALLELYDRDRFEVYGYSCQKIGTYPAYSSEIVWTDIKYLSTENVAKLVTQDHRIDVLVDMSGHTSGNRTDVFCTRLADLQISYLGYPCITGVPDIDKYVIDRTFGWEDRMKTLALEHCFTNYWPPSVPDPASFEQPLRKNGYVSLGTLNKTAKINQVMVNMWDMILDAIPDARLLLRQNYVFKFRNQDRVVFLDHAVTHDDHLARYNKIDIALDTAPYSGTTTTCESMLMGVPVITHAERRFKTIHQNVSASLLINSGMPELVVNCYEEFLAAVKGVMSQIAIDPDYKRHVQAKFLGGAVMDKAQYMRDYETAIAAELHKKREAQ